MIKTEYIRNLNRNFERVILEGQPDYKRYQYCILERGGIKYLLPSSYKNIDGNSYLYYDISSTQNVRQMFSDKYIRREWMKAFFWSMQKMRQELTRFLLDERNIVWSPEHIFQDLEKNDFLYLYIPYEGQEGELEENFERMLEFWVERVDYSDEALSEFVYHAYEQYVSVGQNYLENQIFEDFKKLDEKKAVQDQSAEEGWLVEDGRISASTEGRNNGQAAGKPATSTTGRATAAGRAASVSGRADEGTGRNGTLERGQDNVLPSGKGNTLSAGKGNALHAGRNYAAEVYAVSEEPDAEELTEGSAEKKGIRSFLGNRKRKQEQKNVYREEMRRMINGYAVCEESEYGEKTEETERIAKPAEEYGRTIYIEEKEETVHGLYTEKGEMAVRLEKFPFVLGKRKEDADYVLSDYSASRVHARFIEEEDGIYLEDLNSTNGTFKNGLRMQPYEKRKLEAEDALRFGKSTYVFK